MPDALGVCAALEVDDRLAVPVGDGLVEKLAVDVGLPVAVALGVAVALLVLDALRVDVRLAVLEVLRVAVSERVILKLGDSLWLGDKLCVALNVMTCDSDELLLGVELELGVAVCETENVVAWLIETL